MEKIQRIPWEDHWRLEVGVPERPVVGIAEVQNLLGDSEEVRL